MDSQIYGDVIRISFDRGVPDAGPRSMGLGGEGAQRCGKVAEGKPGAHGRALGDADS